ncbi:DUF6098 family protein [Saccharothrix xinjiangensis]|uniref:DUF6098 family protein n=1 Tax=Saccharothrix xinjiangensis TaxID=204798 RepID=A0ABV9Y9E2_9PSEU
MRTFTDLDELTALVGERAPATELFVRWSRGPDADGGRCRRDGLTGGALPGLSANSPAVGAGGAEVGRGPGTEPPARRPPPIG